MQANYILDTRLRSLRKLEEMQLRAEHDKLMGEKGEIETLLGDESRQWKTIVWQIREIKKKYGPETKSGKRRTDVYKRQIMPKAMASPRRETVFFIVSFHFQ